MLKNTCSPRFLGVVFKEKIPYNSGGKDEG